LRNFSYKQFCDSVSFLKGLVFFCSKSSTTEKVHCWSEICEVFSLEKLSYQLITAMATLHPLATHSSGGAPVIILARIPPEDATMYVMTHEATGCFIANSTLPAAHRTKQTVTQQGGADLYRFSITYGKASILLVRRANIAER
jgi:hypothetical protein